MKVIVEREAFSAAIGGAMRAAGKGNTIPILNNVLLKPNGRALAIAGTNMDIQFETEVAAEISGDSANGATTVLGDALVGIVARMPKGAQLTLEWEEGTARGLSIRAGKSRYKLHTLPVGGFPELPAPKEPVRFVMPAKTLHRALAATRFAITKDKTRYYLAGIYWHHANDEHVAFGGRKQSRMVFVATSGFELARFTVDVPHGSQDMPAVILPELAITEIVRLLADAEGDVSVSSSAGRVSFEHGDNLFTTKLIDGTFPDYARAIPSDNDKTALVETQSLTDALLRLNVLTGKGGTKLDLSPGQFKLSIINPDAGDADETIEVEYDGEPLTIGIRGGGVLAVLDAMQAENCQIHFAGASSPIIFHPMGGAIPDYTRTFVTMPMNV